MTEVGVETLKERFGDYLKRAREGERIVITEHGRSVALLIPLDGDEPARRAWELVESGTAAWGGGKPKGARQRQRVQGGQSASAIVLEDRR